LSLSGVRLEEYVYEKVQGKRPILQLDEGLLGQFMVQAGNQFDAGTPYGKSHLCSGKILHLSFFVKNINLCD